MNSSQERLVKSSERVRDLGEVLTPNATVRAMLDLLPGEIWAPHPSVTFLEPGCGDGNFIVAVLERKLDRIAADFARGELPAGTEVEAARFHALEALAAIYAADISVDNVVGGTPGHEKGARTRLLEMFADWHARALDKRLTELNLAWRAAQWIVEHNIIVGNMMPFDAAGKPTGRDLLPIIAFTFEPGDYSVTVRKTTLGDVMAAEEAKTAGALSLFGPAEPELLWKGEAVRLDEAERVEAPKLKGPARNGTGRR